MDRLKLSAIVELDKQITEKQSEIDYLDSQTGASLWIKDLDEFQEAWAAYSVARTAESVPMAEVEKPKKKRLVVAKK